MNHQPNTPSENDKYVSIIVGNDVTITINVEEIDFTNMVMMRELINHAILQNDKNIIINMEKVTFIGSAGIAMLVQLIKRHASEKRKIDYTRFTPDVMNLLKLLNLHKAFKIF